MATGDDDDDDGDDDTDDDDDAPFLLSGPQHNMTNTSVGEIRRWIQNWKHRTLNTLIRDEESVAGNVERSLACQQIQMNTVILSIIPGHGDKKIRTQRNNPIEIPTIRDGKMHQFPQLYQKRYSTVHHSACGCMKTNVFGTQ